MRLQKSSTREDSISKAQLPHDAVPDPRLNGSKLVKGSDHESLKPQHEKQGSGKPAQKSAQGLKRRRVQENRRSEEGDVPRKKRRLRLDLITSKLSKPFATPTTFLPARRACRSGAWARQRIAGRDLLRRAAIFNTIAMQRRLSGMRGVDHRQLTRRAALIESCPPPLRKPSPSRSRSPRNRKPLDKGPVLDDIDEDYEAFDAYASTDGSGDEDDHSEDLVYSDFNLLREGESYENVGPDEDDYSFGSFESGQTLTDEAGEKAMSLVLETENTSEVSVAPKSFASQSKSVR